MSETPSLIELQQQYQKMEKKILRARVVVAMSLQTVSMYKRNLGLNGVRIFQEIESTLESTLKDLEEK